MSETKRDPTRDPKAGDVVIYGPQWQQERVTVHARKGDLVEYKGERGVLFEVQIHYWREWTKYAEVIHAAE